MVPRLAGFCHAGSTMLKLADFTARVGWCGSAEQQSDPVTTEPEAAAWGKLEQQVTSSRVRYRSPSSAQQPGAADPDSPRSPVDELAQRIAQLSELAQQLPGDSGTLAEDEDFARQLAALRVDLLGLKALAERSSAEDALQRVVRIRSAELRRSAAELVINALGYQVLPNPEPLLIDNEGPIGHHAALPLMLELAGYFGASVSPADEQIATQIGDNWGDGGFSEREALARQIFTANFGGP